MKIAVLGGDGFCGWPSALHLAAEGHHVTIIDNLSRRAIGEKISAPSLTPIRPIQERLSAAKELGDVHFTYCDIAQDYAGFKDILGRLEPEVIVQPLTESLAIEFSEDAGYVVAPLFHDRYLIDRWILGGAVPFKGPQ